MPDSSKDHVSQSSLPKSNPKIPEGINHKNDSPLKEILILAFIAFTFIGLVIGAFMYASDYLAPRIPFSWEQKLAEMIGADSMDSLLEQSDDNCFSGVELTAAENALTRLVRKLEESAELDDEIALTSHLSLSDERNAFATLGGHIFVTTGLIRSVSSENALAMVVAHEIAHVKHRDPARSLSKGLIADLLLSVLGFGDSIIAGAGSHLAMLSYTRDMERDADADALNTLKGTYGTLAGADEFFSKIDPNSELGKWQALLQTHPAVKERLDKIREEIGQSAPRKKTPLNDAFERLRQSCN